MFDKFLKASIAGNIFGDGKEEEIWYWKGDTVIINIYNLKC